ncbi:MAG: hypothetical protein WC497_01530 [Patescibacteria group bacterium]
MNDYRTTLIREFAELKEMELNAGGLYQSILPSISDPADLKILEGIIADENRHAAMVQGIINILEA